MPLQPATNKLDPLTKFGLWNARSIKSKTAASICDFVMENKLDILAMTETFLTGDHTRKDECALADLKSTLPDHVLHHIPRLNRSGGGVCVLLRSGFDVTRNDLCQFPSFEYIDLTVSSKSTSIVLNFPNTISSRLRCSSMILQPLLNL